MVPILPSSNINLKAFPTRMSCSDQFASSQFKFTMHLLTSLVFACVASLAATHGHAEDPPETNIHERASSGLDNSDSVKADFTTWNDLLDTPQFTLQDNDIESSAHDTQCIGISIADLTLPEKEVTCTGMSFLKALRTRDHLRKLPVKYQTPPSTVTFAFPTATLKAAFKRAVECPTGECSCKATNDPNTGTLIISPLS